jgi:archaellum biogenesis protein FlaJ (TadC family)
MKNWLDLYQFIIITIVLALSYLVVLPKFISAANTGMNIGALLMAPLGVMLYAIYVGRFIRRRVDKRREEVRHEDDKGIDS